MANSWILRTGPAGIEELRAYHLAKQHCNAVVPLTMPYVFSKTKGSKQQYVGPSAYSVGSSIIDRSRTPLAIQCLANIVGLDLVRGNPDRHSDNWIVSDDGRLYAIDNEFSGDSITLRQALRPAYFCDMVDDPVYGLLLIAELTAVITRISDHQLVTQTQITAWMRDLSRWLSDLQNVAPSLMMSLDEERYAHPAGRAHDTSGTPRFA